VLQSSIVVLLTLVTPDAPSMYFIPLFQVVKLIELNALLSNAFVQCVQLLHCSSLKYPELCRSKGAKQ
jgi:hypothetical protein